MNKISTQLITEFIGIITFIIFVGGYITSVEVRFSKQDQIDKIVQRIDNMEKMLFELNVDYEVQKRLNRQTYGEPKWTNPMLPPDKLPPLPDVAQIQKDVEEKVEKRIQQSSPKFRK